MLQCGNTQKYYFMKFTSIYGINLAENFVGRLQAYLNLLKPSGNFTYEQVLRLKNSTWCPHCVYVFCTDLRTNSNFCLIKH
jgi:hypothetical protein